MKQWDMRHHGYCPFCLEEDEDVKHVREYNHEDAKKRGKEGLWIFLVVLAKIGTCTRAVLAIKQELTHWRRQDEPPDTRELPEALCEVIIAQRTLGWGAFLDGLWSIKWEAYQKEYFEEEKSRKGSQLWLSKAIRKGWDFNMTIWTGRNKQLQETERIKDMEGKKEIIAVIEKEFGVGLGLGFYIYLRIG